MKIPNELFNKNPRFAGKLLTTFLLPQYTFALDEEQDAVLRRKAAFRFTHTAVSWIFASGIGGTFDRYREALAVPLGEADPGHMCFTMRSGPGMCFALFPRDQQHAYTTETVMTGLVHFGQGLGVSSENRWHFSEHIRGHLTGLVLYLHSVFPHEVSQAAMEATPPPPPGEEEPSSPAATGVAADHHDPELPF